MGEWSVLAESINAVRTIDFHQDVNVSVFETNIRVIG